MGLPWLFIKKMQALGATTVAQGFAMLDAYKVTGNISSLAGFFLTTGASFANMQAFVNGIIPNAEWINVSSFSSGTALAKANTIIGLSPIQRVQAAIGAFQQGYPGYITLGIVGEGNGFVSASAVNITPGAKVFNVCMCGDCVGFNVPGSKHQGILVAMAPNTPESAASAVPITEAPYIKQPIEIKGPTFKEVKIQKEGGTVDDCVNPPCDSIIQVGLALAAFAVKRILESGKPIEDMHISTHVRGNMAADNGFHKINPNGMLSWWNPYNNPGQYDGGGSWIGKEVIVSKNPHGSTYASAYPYLPPPFFQNQYEPDHVADRSGRPYYPIGIPIHIDEKLTNNEEYFIDDIFSVTHYIDFATTEGHDKDYYYDIVKKMLGTSMASNAAYPIWSFWLNFSGSPGYAFEQEFVLKLPGRWYRYYKDEPYDESFQDAYGNTVEINGSSGLPTHIISYREYNDPPPEYPSHSEDPSLYFWAWEATSGIGVVERDVYFSKGFRVRYRNTHSTSGRIAYLGEQTKETMFRTTSNILKDYGSLLTSIFATALGPPGWISLLANVLLGFLPPLEDTVSRSAKHHHFAVQFDIPYRLYYGAWCEPGQLELKPIIGWGTRLIANKKPDIPHFTGSVYAYPVGHIDTGFSGSLGEKYGWITTVDGFPETKAEINWPSNYYFTKTEISLPSHPSQTVQVIKSPNSNEVEVASGSYLYCFPAP